MKMLLSFLFAEVQVAKTIHEVKTIIDTAHKKAKKDNKLAICVWDLDMTLTMCENPAFQMPNLKKHRTIWKEKITKDLSTDDVKKLLHRASQSPQVLIEKDTPDVVSQIQIPGFVCTANSSEYVRTRYDLLKGFGIDFSKFWKINCLTFSEFDKKWRRYPEFYKGILCTNGHEKADLTKAFFKHMGCRPQVVVIVDDRKDVLDGFNLGDDIQVIKVHYTGGLHINSKPISENDFEMEWNKVKRICENV